MACSGIAIFFLAFLAGWASGTPLDDYVNKPDPSYEFRDLGIPVKMDGYTVHYLNMTSQTWLSCEFKLLSVVLQEEFFFLVRACLCFASSMCPSYPTCPM